MSQASLLRSEVPAPTCVVCGGTNFAPMFGGGNRTEQPKTSVPYRITHSSRELVGTIERCRDCGMGRLPPRAAEIGNYTEGADERFAEQVDIRRRNAERFLGLLPAPSPGAALLDVGSAYGFLLLAARGLGYAPVGVEPSREAAEHARRAYGLEVFHGPIQTAPFGPNSFDVITLADVIEHFEDPSDVIQRLHRLLRPNGRLLILTPDLNSAVARVLGRHWWGLLDDHYSYFSRATLSRFLQQHGFATEQVRSFGRAFPVSHWIFKLSQYHAGAYRVCERLVRAVGLAEVEVPLNLGDQMACVARRVD